ncbi:hypothetical protein [Nostoc sp. UHCC 0251]|uniref:hypothetical protein n=1 Tax=Nostoc sp. UHCC 0251 TaxID=3110240 RepID=UPI002B20B50C|nr:hypothetical protein [Nostoc sp. UHCC 0251]MEA5626083.1 hypothetical protein [Nostoc sp. UHCC 0251]
MKKQPIFFNFALALTVFTYLMGAPMRVNAGTGNITGGSEDSSSSSGDNFNPGNAQPPVEPAPGVNVEFNNNGIGTSIEIQNNLNETASNILSQIGNTNTPDVIIAVVLQDGQNPEEAASQIHSCMLSLGASPSSSKSLVSALWGMARAKTDVNKEKPILATNTKCSATYTTIFDKTEPAIVNINKLNAAITAYNNIVMESNPEVLRKLGKNPQFLEVGKLLKQLRAVLNKS